MTLVENLKPGDYVSIMSCESEKVPGWVEVENPTYPVDGLPLEILAIDLPWILIRPGTHSGTSTIDYRICKLKKLSRQYVEAFFSAHQNKSTRKRSKLAKRLAKKPTEPQLFDATMCPRCHTKMVQLRTGPAEWRLRCNQCGFQGDKV